MVTKCQLILGCSQPICWPPILNAHQQAFEGINLVVDYSTLSTGVRVLVGVLGVILLVRVLDVILLVRVLGVILLVSVLGVMMAMTYSIMPCDRFVYRMNIYKVKLNLLKYISGEYPGSAPPMTLFC